ncbi:hypothetical protein JTE90_011250 [Oedothorax gibbosus]|uniref:F-actin monooxygenase n=1 Tax=Oedothorax gibbosus TaxID=931172 RepID=A0AAV6VXX7_9ARAC|nr:hypothetical protein JTE90_011250 [Oedothorax gibbosus]
MEPRGGKAVPRAPATSPESAMASELFDQFVVAATFKSVLHSNRLLCDLLRLKPTNITNFYPRLKAKLHSWRAASLWAKLDKRASHKCYNRGKACPNTRVLIIGAGPCGLRTAIEAQLLGAKVVVVEKRDRFSRNNVLHLWPFVIHDLRNLGAKKFFGKFCAGSIDHISIRQLQIILLKVALLLGVEVHENVGFEGLVEPPEDQQERIGWRAQVSPPDHPVSQYEFDVLIGADGKRNTLLGFNRKEFRGKLAIAVTANFINKHTMEEARVPEISGVAFIFNQKFFQDMKEQTAIDLENIVYYKDDTHYFVMTAKKQSLLERGVIIQDFNDTARLLSMENVDREALMEYARDAADFATSYQLPHTDFAVNHYGQADVAMFDFTSMYAAENACRVIERRGHKLLQGLVGDSLLEPFWPTGSGCARGFLSSFDAAWMIRSWAAGKFTTLQVLSERESIYRLLAQTTPENLSKDLNQYTLSPSSRYPNLNLQAVLPSQVRNLFNTDGKVEENADVAIEAPKKKRRRESMIHPDTLLNWCQKQVALSDKVKIQDFTSSWKNGLALCSILHHYRPDLMDISALDPENVSKNNQLAFDICERELGIPPVMTGQEMAECAVPDKLTMVSYISQVYESFRGEIPVVSRPKTHVEERTASPSKQFISTPLSVLNKGISRLQGKKRYSIEKEIAKERERGENIKKRSSLLTHKRRSREKAFIQEKDIILTDYKSIPENNKPRESINTRVRNLEEKMKKDAGLRCHQSEETESRAAHVRSEPSELNIKMLQRQLQNNGNEADVKKVKMPKVGKLRKDEWNVKIIEEKTKQLHTRQLKTVNPEKPKIFQDIFAHKLQQMDEKLKAGGTLTEEEEARYKKFDASLNKLKDRLAKGNLEAGEKGHNQTAAMTEHMTKIWDKKAIKKTSPGLVTKTVAETDSKKSSAGSTICYFCKERVYLMERLSAEGLFFHRTCFKCEYCGTALRLGDYAFDKDAGGKFYCTPHFRMQKTDLRQQEMMKRKQAFLSCALEKQEKEKLYQILLDNTEKALSPSRSSTGAVSPTVTDSPAAHPTNDVRISPSNLLAEPPGVVGRDQTPERVEYENSIIEMSEDELLTSELEEEELTQKNLGPSHDLATSEDDYSDLSTDSESDEEAFAEELERSLTADETRKLAETWNRKYSTLSYPSESSSSSADDEGSDTEIGSDDTSHDIDSDAEYSIENSEEDGASADKESEHPGVSKTPDEKEFIMQVPVIDLKAINKVPEDDSTSESLSEDTTDSEEDSDEETGTEVESESDSAPLPPPQIPTIVIYESPPQNTDLDQDWNGTALAKPNDIPVLDDTIVLSSDASALDSSVEVVEDLSHNLEEAVALAEPPLATEGKSIQPGDLEKGLDSPSSNKEAGISFVGAFETKPSLPDQQSDSSEIVENKPSHAENTEQEASPQIVESILPNAEKKESNPKESVIVPSIIESKALLPTAGYEFVEKVTDKSVAIEKNEAKVSSPDGKIESPTKFKAPLATGESSSDLSNSSDIDSLAKEIVSGVIKAAQDTVVEIQPSESASTEDIEPNLTISKDLKETKENVVQASKESEISCIILDTDAALSPSNDNVVAPVKISDESILEQTQNIDEVTSCSLLPKLSFTKDFIVRDDQMEENIQTEENDVANKKVPTSVNSAKIPDAVPVNDIAVDRTLDKFDSSKEKTDVNETIVLDDSDDVSMCGVYLDDSFENEKETPSFITMRKKNHSKNDSYDWDSDKSPSTMPYSYFEEEDSVIPIDSFVAKNANKSNHDHQTDSEKYTKLPENENNAFALKSIEIHKSPPYNYDVSKHEQSYISCLSQSLPNSSNSFLQGSSFPKTVSYTSEFTNAKSNETGSKTPTPTNYLNKLLPPLESKAESADTLSKGSNDSKYPYEVIDLMSRSDTLVSRSPSIADHSSDLSNSSKDDSKYKGYSGSFAEKVRPKSLFCDAIYLRSLDIKLQTQPFPSLNKSNDTLDEYCKSEDEDNVRRKLFDENNKSVEDLDASDFGPSFASSKGPVCSTPCNAASTTCLKKRDSLEKQDKAPSFHSNKQKGSKHSSVSFSAPESCSDLVSPYNCGQAKSSQEKSFPTKVKPKCDMDISRLKQKREKRKSVHEDIQGLPFFDEEKMMSPVEPFASTEVFEAAKDQTCVTPVSKTPDLIDEDRYLRMQSTVEQEKARQEARARARLKSDEELGLSPNNYRKKYRRQLSLNSINYDELCSDEFCDQDDELEDDVMNSFCQTKITGIEETFSMFKNSDLCSKSKVPPASSQKPPIDSYEPCVLPLATNETFESTDTLNAVEGTSNDSTPQRKTTKHSTISSPETSPDIFVLEKPSFDSKTKAKSKGSLTEVSGDDDKTKSNGRKSIFSILNFSKGHQSKDKIKHKSKGSEKEFSSSLPSDFGAQTNTKTKPFSNLKLSKSKEKCNKIKSKSVPPESSLMSPNEVADHPVVPINISFMSQQAKVIPKYSVYRNPETSISTFPVHLPLPKIENGLAPKASEDSFSDEEDTQGSRAGHISNMEKTDKEKKTQRIVQKVQKQQVLKRLRNAQEIQRSLDELEIRQKELEQQGVEVEKMLRGEQQGE